MDNVYRNEGKTLFGHIRNKGNELKMAMCIEMKERLCLDTLVIKGMC